MSHILPNEISGVFPHDVNEWIQMLSNIFCEYAHNWLWIIHKLTRRKWISFTDVWRLFVINGYKKMNKYFNAVYALPNTYVNYSVKPSKSYTERGIYCPLECKCKCKNPIVAKLLKI